MGWAMAQPGARIDLPKPEKYENRTLASERTGTGRINPVRRLQQNIVTRYNFNFNAANELNDVIEAARQTTKDDYTRLLPFDDYSLESTAAQREELDSVILKCNNGILLHDLRNDWVDDLYLLMGMAYFHRKEFDSAAIAFQYINYAFQPRSRDEVGFDKAIGSRINGEGSAFNISTPERKGPVMRALSHAPARNDAMLWLLRTLIEQGRMNEAGGLIETLRRDASLPERLRPRLQAAQALWHYRSGQWDSAAVHLEAALNDEGGAGRARKEYLAGQLYALAGRPADAERMYTRAIGHTTDPVMEAQARIQQIGLRTDRSDSLRIRNSLVELDRMSRRSRYEDYRQIIHYAAYRLELLRGDTAAAIRQMRMSIDHAAADAALKARSFRELADIAFLRRDYLSAADSYDSVQTELLDAADTQQVAVRARVLRRVAALLHTLRAQDSLLRIADMPEAERQAYVLKLSRALRKAQGLREEADPTPTSPSGPTPPRDDAPVNLFAANTGKGDWYFYNGSLRTQGFRQFQARWGKRPNLDNWRRIAAIEAQLNAARQTDPGAPGMPGNPPDAGKASPDPSIPQAPPDLSREGLLAGLPLTDSLRRIAHDSIQSALLGLGIVFREELDRCGEARQHLTDLLDRYPRTTLMETAIFHLCACLRRSGDMARYEFYRRQLADRFRDSRLLAALENPGALQEEHDAERRDADKRYEEVLTLMIQGRFEEAMDRKRAADSSFGKKYWTAQLLYIEALHHVRERRDSLAGAALQAIREREPGTPMARKAADLEAVLKRRAEIEDHLTRLEIRRYPEDSLVLPDEGPVVKAISNTGSDSARANIVPLSGATPTPTADSSRAQGNPLAGRPTPAPAADSSRQPTPRPTFAPGTPRTAFLHQPADSHAVILVLTRVDVVYRTEARISLNKYNTAYHADMGLSAAAVNLTDEVRLVKVGPFDQLATALNYQKAAREAATREIFPWLPADTYRFLPVSLPNLELLLRERNLDAYMAFLRQALPDGF